MKHAIHNFEFGDTRYTFQVVNCATKKSKEKRETRNYFLTLASTNFLTHRKLRFDGRYSVYEMLGTLYASANSRKMVMTEISSLSLVQCLRGVLSLITLRCSIGKQFEISPGHSRISCLNSIVNFNEELQ